MSKREGNFDRKDFPYPSRGLLEASDDERLAVSLRERFERDGGLLGWGPLGDGRWEAWLSWPGLPQFVSCRGGSRVAAISGAHGAALRLLELCARRRDTNREPARGFDNFPENF